MQKGGRNPNLETLISAQPTLCSFCCWVLCYSCARHYSSGRWILAGRIRTTGWEGRRLSRVSSIPSSMPSPIWQWAQSEPESSSSSSPTSRTRSIVTSAARIPSLPTLRPTKPWSLCFPTTIKAPDIISLFHLFFFWVGSGVFQAAA